MWETSGTNFTDIPATPYNESQYPMRGHIYWDRSQSYAAGDAFPASTSATQTFPVDPIVESVGDPAGFVQPENIPVLEYLSASQVRAKAALGAASALRLLLNDGVRYQAASPLALDLTVSGRGGLDTGSEAPNTWYYVYAVPSTTSGLFEILCSATPPPTGPTGYATWRYLGAFRNDASSNILVFYQDGASFRYSDRQRVAALGSGTDGAPVALSLAAHAPATARIVDVLWYYQAAGTAGQLIGWADGRQGGGGDNGQWQIRANCADNTFGSDTVAGSISTVTNPKQIYYQRLSSCNGALVDILGWLDGYLAALPSQLQAEYVPDTAQPQLAWRGNSRIDVLPAPGQPSTVLLTLQDGRQRNFSPSLVWDPSTGVADGGLDTGTEQASSWY